MRSTHDAGRQAEQDERQERERRQQAELEGRDHEDGGGDDRDRQPGDLVTELTDRLADPEADEVAVVNEVRVG